MAHESNNLAAGLLLWARKREREFMSNSVTNPSKYSLAAKSWQELYHLYFQYGFRITELARMQEVFGLSMVDRGAHLGDSAFSVVQDAFRRDVTETDSMLVLLDAEIARRNTLIGVMG